MENIKKYSYIVFGYMILVLILYGANLFFEFESMWGLNHLLFIEKPVIYLFIVPFLFILISSLFIKESFFENIIKEKVHTYIFENKITFSLFLTTLLLFLYFLKIETFFLGDGYSWIASFGYSDYFLVKPTEFLSSYIIRGIQFILGGYTKETSLLAFQIASILSGIFFFFNLKNIIDLLFKEKLLKIFTFLSFLFSGLIVLFMGYVEFYPMLWMAASFYVYFSLKSLHSPKYILWSVLSFVIMILIHAQAIYLSFGFIYLLVWRKFDKEKTKQYLQKHLTRILIISTALSIAITYLMYQNNKIAQILLPLFSSNPENPGYTVFSISHIFDILNLIFLLFPFLIVFVILITLSFQKLTFDKISIYLIISSIGSLLFLIFVNPYIGFARDWDLMSMTLLFPMLLTLYLFESTKIKLHGRTIVIALSLLLMFSSSYLYVNISKEKSLHRFEMLLKMKQGLQFRPGWTILNNYYLDIGERDKSISLQNEMKQRFTDYLFIPIAYKKIGLGKFQDAYIISTNLIQKYPDNIDFIQLRASVFMEMNKYDSAQFYLDKALKIQSTYPSVLKIQGDLLIRKGDYYSAAIVLEKANLISHEKMDILELLSSCYIRTGEVDKAIEIAKTIYLKDKKSPSYFVVSMVIYLYNNNKEKALYHYQQFLKFGKDRDDYDQIKRDFSFLVGEN